MSVPVFVIGQRPVDNIVKVRVVTVTSCISERRRCARGFERLA